MSAQKFILRAAQSGAIVRGAAGDLLTANADGTWGPAAPASGGLPDGGQMLLSATGSTQGTVTWAGSTAAYRAGVGDVLAQMRLIADAGKWTLPDATLPRVVFGGTSGTYLARCDVQVGLINNPTDQLVSIAIAKDADLVGGAIVSAAAMLAGCLPIQCKFTAVDQCWLHAVRRVSLVSGQALSLALATSTSQDIVAHSVSLSFTEVHP